MKYKTTRKALVNSANNLRYAGYCNLSFLLNNHEPTAYTCGVYGWNYDVYTVHGLTICTGYRNMPGERLQKVSEYEQKAQEIMNSYDIPYEERKNRIDELLKEFCILNGGY